MNDAASAVPDATQWYPATRNLIRELLRCAERGGGRDDRGTIACQRLICRGTELAPPDSDKPPTGRETNRPLRVPDPTPWPCDLVDASIRIACSCGGGGGGDPCEGVVCGNDNLCTDDWCSNGFCGHTPILCPPTDNNPCADHKCDSGDCVTIFNSAPCDDGNPCTQDDTCSFGGCAGTPIICPELPCNSGACLSGIRKYTPVAGACDDDGNLCTDDVCAGGTCTNPPNSDPCDDEDPCTVDDTCSAGSCSGTQKDCSALDTQCKEGVCDPPTGTCTTADANKGGSCTDSCGGSICRAGSCVSETSADCDNENPCTDDEPDSCAGCIHTPNTAPCDDQDPCTQDDRCANGVCVGRPIDCSDNNPCTNDACTQSTGLCTHVNNSLTCDDDDPCTTGEGMHPAFARGPSTRSVRRCRVRWIMSSTVKVSQ